MLPVYGLPVTRNLLTGKKRKNNNWQLIQIPVEFTCFTGKNVKNNSNISIKFNQGQNLRVSLVEEEIIETFAINLVTERIYGFYESKEEKNN